MAIARTVWNIGWELLLVSLLNPTRRGRRTPYAWEIPGTDLCGHAESPESAFHDGLAAYAIFVNKQAAWDGYN
jgi:hypothetical protein